MGWQLRLPTSLQSGYPEALSLLTHTAPCPTIKLSHFSSCFWVYRAQVRVTDSLAIQQALNKQLLPVLLWLVFILVHTGHHEFSRGYAKSLSCTTPICFPCWFIWACVWLVFSFHFISFHFYLFYFICIWVGISPAGNSQPLCLKLFIVLM